MLARERDGTVLIVDYKTDRLGEESPAALVERAYATQRRSTRSPRCTSGAPRVEVAHCLLERPAEPVAATFDGADAPALADALLGLAAGVLAEDWPVAAAPAPRALRRLPRPALALLVARGDDAAPAPRPPTRTRPAPWPGSGGPS